MVLDDIAAVERTSALEHEPVGTGLTPELVVRGLAVVAWKSGTGRKGASQMRADPPAGAMDATGVQVRLMVDLLFPWGVESPELRPFAWMGRDFVRCVRNASGHMHL